MHQIDSWMRHKLRCYRLKQCGRKYTIFKMLCNLGIPESTYVRWCGGDGGLTPSSYPFDATLSLRNPSSQINKRSFQTRKAGKSPETASPEA